MRLTTATDASELGLVIDGHRRARRLVFIGPERTDARSVKRIVALTAEGWRVTGFTFHRDCGQPDPPPAWENIHLGTTYNRRYLHRLWAIVRAFGIMWKHRGRLREARCMYVINPDNAFLALFGRLVCRRRSPLVLEIADIQPAMTRAGFKSRLLRAIERFVLRRCQLLVTTSPGFLRHYFEPLQRWKGPVFMLENKVWPTASLVVGRRPRTRPAQDGVWTVGYFGLMRCRRSLDLICQLAAAWPGRLRFVLRGAPSGIDPDAFHRGITAHPNIDYGGPYRYPDDLPALYGGVDFNWCLDFSAADANSAWLLPNRIYEGGLFHCPALACEGTETAHWLTTLGLGKVFGEDLFEQLRDFFARLTPQEWNAMRMQCAAAQDDLFTGEEDYRRLGTVLESAGETSGPQPAHPQDRRPRRVIGISRAPSLPGPVSA